MCNNHSTTEYKGYKCCSIDFSVNNKQIIEYLRCKTVYSSQKHMQILEQSGIKIIKKDLEFMFQF